MLVPVRSLNALVVNCLRLALAKLFGDASWQHTTMNTKSSVDWQPTRRCRWASLATCRPNVHARVRHDMWQLQLFIAFRHGTLEPEAFPDSPCAHLLTMAYHASSLLYNVCRCPPDGSKTTIRIACHVESCASGFSYPNITSMRFLYNPNTIPI